MYLGTGKSLNNTRLDNKPKLCRCFHFTISQITDEKCKNSVSFIPTDLLLKPQMGNFFFAIIISFKKIALNKPFNRKKIFPSPNGIKNMHSFHMPNRYLPNGIIYSKYNYTMLEGPDGKEKMFPGFACPSFFLLCLHLQIIDIM